MTTSFTSSFVASCFSATCCLRIQRRGNHWTRGEDYTDGCPQRLGCGAISRCKSVVDSRGKRNLRSISVFIEVVSFMLFVTEYQKTVITNFKICTCKYTLFPFHWPVFNTAIHNQWLPVSASHFLISHLQANVV